MIRHESTQEGHERQCCKCFGDREYEINRRDTPQEFRRGVIVGNKVFATSDGEAAVFDLDTGKVEWSYTQDIICASAATYADGWLVDSRSPRKWRMPADIDHSPVVAAIRNSGSEHVLRSPRPAVRPAGANRPGGTESVQTQQKHAQHLTAIFD